MYKWRDTCNEEMETFLGILIAMGMSHLPKMRLYWSKKPLYRNDLIRNAMKRERFEQLIKCLHFNNNEEEPENRLSKIQPLLDLLIAKFKGTLIPSENIVIDESMIPWRGRLILRQYLPGKSHNYVCLRPTHINLKIYAGKRDSPGMSGIGLGHQVVLELIDGLLHEGRTLYVDNFYTSVPLAEDLLGKKTYVCGTLRRNPKEVCAKNIKKGEILAKENEKGVKVIKWQDKRPVIMINTNLSIKDNLVSSVSKKRKTVDPEPLSSNPASAAGISSHNDCN
ncbi:hypothetical protein J437_LFUL011956 [Ladona fulva]|uniref:PiggyBac transposable element-derived protein domain-containing protein n=1 Tax=Ladona fulva TaxID=123851 RepID=A0A8K0KBT9_LADFU|nr:hypothetical protein J437_LFUL011956 [Ladona fulva]